MAMGTTDSVDARTKLALDRIDKNADEIEQLLVQIRQDVAEARATRKEHGLDADD